MKIGGAWGIEAWGSGEQRPGFLGLQMRGLWTRGLRMRGLRGLRRRGLRMRRLRMRGVRMRKVTTHAHRNWLLSFTHCAAS